MATTYRLHSSKKGGASVVNAVAIRFRWLVVERRSAGGAVTAMSKKCRRCDTTQTFMVATLFDLRTAMKN